jgi:hypothetical protein
MSTATRWLLAMLIALAVGLSWQLDGPDDTQAAQDQSDALTELQAAAPGSARQQAAADRLCLQERGPNSMAVWLEDGSLACTTRRGLVTAQVQP